MRSRQRTRARRDRGNMVALMLVALLVISSMVYTVLGSGQRLVQKEVISNSADAAAMAGAVVRAKALNFISFTNLVMANVLAMDIALQGITNGLTAYLPVAAAACAAQQYDFCEHIAPATALRQRYQSAASAMEDDLRMLAKGERTIAKMAPALALVEAYRAGTHSTFKANYGSGLEVVPVPPKPEDLPVEDGSWDELWQHAQGPGVAIDAMAIARYWQALNPGPPRPVGVAFGMGSAAIPVEDAIKRGEVDGSALPLKLVGDWKKKRFFRVMSMLGNSHAGWRRGLAAMGAHQKGAGVPEPTEATAQGEFFAFNRHEDLWHMNWRARLSLSEPFVPVPGNLREFWVH